MQTIEKLESQGVSAESTPHYNLRVIWLLSSIAAMGGLLFGYDWVVIGGAKPFFEPYFALTDASAKGWANSCALVGCLVGALLSGALSDRFGRKSLLIAAAVLFAGSSVGTGLAYSFSMFVFNRILGGVAIGLASNLSPLYIAEVAPAAVRGKFVSINQLMLNVGILTAQLVNWGIYNLHPLAPEATTEVILASWNGQWGWRWMFIATALPSLLFLVGMLLVPETPRYLVKRGRHARARAVLERIGGAAYAEATLIEIQATLAGQDEKVAFRELLHPRLFKILTLGIVLAVFQQWCGINVVFTYAEEIFKAAGYAVSGIMFNIVVTGVTFLVFTLVAIHMVDKLGRRALMLAGAAGLTLCYALLGYSYYAQIQGVAVLILVLAAIACYAFSLAPITWVILSEIFPNRIRGMAMSTAVFALWVACFSLTYTFPLIIKAVGAAGTFWGYAMVCALGFVFIKLCLPETKGKTLEQIERELID